MNNQIKEDAARRLLKIEGQVRGIATMVEDERYCIDILTQVASVRAALGKVGSLLLQNHLETCVKGAMQSQDEDDVEAKIAELTTVFNRYLAK